MIIYLNSLYKLPIKKAINNDLDQEIVFQKAIQAGYPIIAAIRVDLCCNSKDNRLGYVSLNLVNQPEGNGQ